MNINQDRGRWGHGVQQKHQHIKIRFKHDRKQKNRKSFQGGFQGEYLLSEQNRHDHVHFDGLTFFTDSMCLFIL